MTRRTIRNGSVQLVMQCRTCGDAVGSPVGRKEAERLYAIDKLPPFDPEIRVAFDVRSFAEYEEKRGRQKREFDDWYATYRGSPEWKRRRDLVMRRCGGICEGCGESPAAVVHHLTYDHVGDELLFELVGVCDRCHDRAHGRDAEQG